MERLGTDSLQLILLRLNPKDRTALSETCKSLRQACNLRPVWRNTELEFAIEFEDPVKDFACFMRKFGKFYIAHKLVLSWVAKIKNLTENDLVSFNWDSTATFKELSSYWGIYEYNIHTASYLLLHHYVNGQLCTMEHMTGFFGGYLCYNGMTNIYWVGLNSENLGVNNTGISGGDLIVLPDGMVCHGCLEDSAPVRYIELEHFADFFSRHLDDWIAGRKNPKQVVQINRFNPEGRIIPTRVNLVPLYPCSGEGNFELTTVVELFQMKISVSSVPMFFDSQVDSYTYGITILAVRCPDAIQLQSRYWEIVYNSGEMETVQGDGVIGQFPRFSKAGDEYFYTSACSTRSGSAGDSPRCMQGHFIFRTMSDSKKLQINVPKFTFPRILKNL